MNPIAYFTFFVALGCLCACTPTFHTRGNFIEPELLAKVVPGKTTRGEVRLILGPPSTEGFLAGDEWYYIGEHTETVSFLKPKTTAYRLFIIDFDERGYVKSIKTIDQKTHHIEPVKAKTPTYGKDPSLVAEVLGNIGRYEEPKDSRRRRG